LDILLIAERVLWGSFDHVLQFRTFQTLSRSERCHAIVSKVEIGRSAVAKCNDGPNLYSFIVHSSNEINVHKRADSGEEAFVEALKRDDLFVESALKVLEKLKERGYFTISTESNLQEIFKSEG